MANSITASTVSPFTGLLLEDANYVVTGAFVVGTTGTTYTPSVNLANVDYPVVGKFIVQVFNTALTNTAGGVQSWISLQESSDNSTFNNIGAFTSSLLTFTDSSGTAAAGTTQVLLTPKAKQYLRAAAVVNTGGSTAGGITGSFGLALLF